MSKSFTGDHALARLTEGQTADAALESDTFSDDKNNRRPEPAEAAELAAIANSLSASNRSPQTRTTKKRVARRSRSRMKAKRSVPANAAKHRFGLPDNFVHRGQGFGRTVLLDLNIYRLPNGQEYLPTPPVGTLGARQHLYALLTLEQYLAQRRGSVYVRTDGRIFNYSVDNGNSEGDIFDTGYTIYDLERTGHYAPQLSSRRKKREPGKVRAAAGS